MSSTLQILKDVWPKCDMPSAQQKALSASIDAIKLSTDQIRAVCLAHATEDEFATKNPKAARLLQRLKSLVLETSRYETSQKPIETRIGDDDRQWLIGERKRQSKSNPKAFDVPDWKIVAAYIDTDVSGRTIPMERDQGLDASVWTVNALKTYGASEADAIHAASVIYGYSVKAIGERWDARLARSKTHRINFAKLAKKADSEQAARLATA